MITKFKVSRKIFIPSLLCGLLCAVFLSFSSFNASCEDLRQNVLRLHIVANSDNVKDQQLKLKIRDEILSQSGNIFEKSEDVEDALATAQKKVKLFEEIANEVIKKEGFDYKASAKIGDSYFETRNYEDFTLPAGVYKSLIIELGKAKGKNWWCVIFPEVCIPTASKVGLDKTVNANGCQIAENSNRYIMRFKAVELYEDIKKFFK